jgi:hypothetical protein
MRARRRPARSTQLLVHQAEEAEAAVGEVRLAAVIKPSARVPKTISSPNATQRFLHAYNAFNAAMLIEDTSGSASTTLAHEDHHR